MEQQREPGRGPGASTLVPRLLGEKALPERERAPGRQVPTRGHGPRWVCPGGPGRAIPPDSFYLSSCRHTEPCPHQDADTYQGTPGHMPDHVLHQPICEPHEIPQLSQVRSSQLGCFQIGPRNRRLTPHPEHSNQPSVTWLFRQTLVCFGLTELLELLNGTGRISPPKPAPAAPRKRSSYQTLTSD